MENNGLWERVNTLSATVTRLETRMEEHAPRRWVEGLLAPIEKSISKIELSVTSLSEQGKELYEAHNALLREKSQRELQELQSKTLPAMLKKYGALAGAIGSIWFAMTIARALVEGWLRQHGFQ